MSRVSVDKERLEAIIKEKSECDCTYGDCPLVPDACATKTDGNWGFLCNQKTTIIDWLEAKKPTVDWSNVAVDTRVLVKCIDGVWKHRYFAKYKNDRVYCFSHGRSSFTLSSDIDALVAWDFAKLYDEEDLKD